MKNIAKVFSAVVLLSSCGAQKHVGQDGVLQDVEDVLPYAPSPSRTPASAMAHVKIYRMSGDYANLVPVTLNEAGTQLTSYPDPKDIRPTSKPEYLTDGWYLDHRGVSYNTAFTSYTYDEYRKLPKVPTQAELMSRIVARKAVIEIRDLGTESLPLDSIISLLKK